MCEVFRASNIEISLLYILKNQLLGIQTKKQKTKKPKTTFAGCM